jgi:hypothetical protein
VRHHALTQAAAARGDSARVGDAIVMQSKQSIVRTHGWLMKKAERSFQTP